MIYSPKNPQSKKQPSVPLTNTSLTSTVYWALQEAWKAFRNETDKESVALSDTQMQLKFLLAHI